MAKRMTFKTGRPALVCVPTGETITIDGKRYKKVKLKYDIEQNYMPYAFIKPA